MLNSVKTAKTINPQFVIKGERAEWVASLDGIDGTWLSHKGHFEIGKFRPLVSLGHRVQTLFSLLGYLPQYVVDGIKNFVQASPRRTGKLAEWLNSVAKGIRTFHVWDARFAASTPSTLQFVTVLNVHVRNWKEEVA